MNQNIPEVNMGVTINFYSDRTAATIIQVTNNGKKFVCREDTSIRTDKNGMSDSQTYSYQPNPDGKLFFVSQRKDGRFRVSVSGEVVSLGIRRKFHDFSF